MSTATSNSHRKIAKRTGLIGAVAAVVVAILLAFPMTGDAAATWTQKADPSTNTAPKSTLSTENVGEVWTDKTVSAGTDGTFNVQLSALSSAGSATVSEQQPLDIVLVVDTSGSMAEMNSVVYADDLDTSQTYISSTNINTNLGYAYYTKYYTAGTSFTDSQGTTHQVTTSGWYRTYNGYGPVYAKTSASDTNSQHYYFSPGTRLMYLQNAVNNFLDSTNTLNSTITDDSKKNRVAMVKFCNRTPANTIGNYRGYSQVVSDFTTDTASLETQVNELDPTGETASNVGLQLANEVMNGDDNHYTLTGARDNAKRVVIFFTDGVPTDYGSTFASNIANSAVSYASQLKGNNALVYSVGTFTGVDPSIYNGTSSSSETVKANTFLNAVSSNFPEATQWDSDHLGDRVADSEQYFYGSEDASQLTEIYEDIFHQITTGSGYPVNINTGEDPNTHGYVTFSDTLDNYMQVKSVDSIEFNGTTYSNKTTSTADGVTTYTFSNAVSTPIAGDTNLQNIIIKVSSSGAEAAAGDVVTVQVPAALMPMNYFDLQTDTDGTTTLSKVSQNPVRVNYTVSMKSYFKDAIDNNDFSKISTSYMSANTDEDGMLSFYTNSYDSGDDGETTASFTPASTNNYYTFTSDTLLYTSSAGTTQATAITSGQSYYYRYTYWTSDSNGGAATSHTEYVELTSDEIAALQASGNITSDDDHGGYYIKSGSRHVDHLGSTAKADNTTSTATNASDESMNNGVVSNALGNNGQLSVPRPGDLQITKHIDLPAGAGDHSSDTFTVNVHVDGAAGNTYDVAVTDSEGNPVSGAITTLTFNSNGDATCSIMPDQTITIRNLTSGSSYTVTESDLPDGYTTESITGGTGTINATTTQSAVITNKYEITPASGSIPVDLVKNMQNREFLSTDQFVFYVSTQYQGDAVIPAGELPLPSLVTRVGTSNVGMVTISNLSGSTYEASFGTITVSEPGTYTFRITEALPDGVTLDGVSISQATYEVTVVAKDDGNGGLTFADPLPVLTQTISDTGQPLTSNNTQEIDVTLQTRAKAEFTNRYDSENITQRLQGAKIYTDSTGSKPLTAGMFHFRLEPTGTNASIAPMPTGSENGVYYTTNDASGNIPLGSLDLDQSMVGQTYTYRVVEQVDDPSTTEVETAVTGMSYDTRNTSQSEDFHTISVTVNQSSTGVLSATVVYSDGGTTVASGNRFYNTYQATSTQAEIVGSKILTGRDMQSGETFNFTLTPDSATQTAIDAGWLTAPSSTATASGGTNGQLANFSFGNVTFNHAGTYKFTMAETAGSKGGVSYDSHSCTVTITVTDNDGQLVASVDYGTYQGQPANQFRNSYTAQMTYPGINVSKTLTGRDMESGQFSYTIIGQRAADGSTTAQQATAKLAESDLNFSNPEAAADGVEDVWAKLVAISFDQDDAGKTFTYRLAETSGATSGYTYDTTVYTVAITVIDNGDGTLKTSTTITGSDGYSQTVENTSMSSSDGTIDAPSTSTTRAKAPFNNSYSATGTLDGSTNLRVTKDLVGRAWNSSESFTYTLAAADNATQTAINNGVIVMPDTTLTISDTTTDHTASYGNITFNKAGRYTFYVKENLPDADDDDAETDGYQHEGLTYDESQPTIIVNVVDNGNGTLTCTKDPASGALTFTNTYEPEPVTASWEGQKFLDGRNFQDGDEFTFRIGGSYSGTATDVEVPMPAVLSDVTETNGITTGYWTWKYEDYSESSLTYIDNSHFKLLSGPLTFTEAGTYTYQIGEVGGSLPGITYSRATYTATLVVTDDGHGNLQVASNKITQQFDDDGTAVADPSAEATGLFTNKSATDVTIHLDGVKTYSDSTGANPLTNNMFEFTLKPSGDNAASAPMPSGSTGSGADRVFTSSNLGNTVTLGSIDLTTNDIGQTYHYVAQEVVPDGATDNNDGTYTLYGMTYDGSAHDITVVVSEDATTHAVVPTITYEDDNGASYAIFANAYSPESGTTEITGTKQLNGRDMLSGETFGFTLAPADDATRQAINGGNITVGSNTASVSGATNGAETEFSFGEFSFKTVGTYTFTMSENAGTAGGVEYDSHTCTVTVTVTDNGDGTLSATATYSQYTPTGGTARAGNKFINEYTRSNATVPVTVTKVLTGRTPGLQDGEFGFTMTINGTSGASGNGWTVTATDGSADGQAHNNATGVADFGKVEFSAVGTYHVVVKENIPAASDQDPYMTYDTHSYEFDISIADNNNGALTPTISNVVGSSTFTNSRNVPDDTKTVAEADSEGNIVIQNAEGEMVSVGDRLHYSINWYNDAVDSTGKPQAATVTITDRVPDGTVYVGDSATTGTGITVSAPSDGGTGSIEWTIDAAAGASGTVSFDVTVSETAFDQMFHTVMNSATVQIGENDPTTTNEVRNTVPEKEVLNSSSVDVNNQQVSVGDTLTYRIDYANVKQTDETVIITDTLEDGLTFVSASNGGTYDETTRTITWTLANVHPNTAGSVTFKALVNENALTDSSVDNTATLKVGNDAEVTNKTHNTVSKGNITLAKSIRLNDSDATTIDTSKEFTFTVTLKDKNGSALTGSYGFTGTSDGTTAYTGTITPTNNTITLKSGGSVTINDIPEGATWTISEAAEDGYTPNVSWDRTGTIPSGGTVQANFSNTYSLEDATVPLTVNKVLTGRTPGLQADEFSFTAVVSGPDGGWSMDSTTATNAAPESGVDYGVTDFGDISFSKVGTYTVSVTENIPSDATTTIDGTTVTYGSATTAQKAAATSWVKNGMTYDNHTYTFPVVVTDDGEGNLVATVGTVSGDQTFTNTYEEPDNTKTVSSTHVASDGTSTVTSDADGKTVGVGDTLTYTINWHNNAIDSTTGQLVAATVAITDDIPDGTVFVDGSAKAYNSAGAQIGTGTYEDGTITWELTNRPAGDSGTAIFQVTVDGSAVDNDDNTISNKALVNDAETNTVTNTVPEKHVSQTSSSDNTTIEDADGNLVGVGDILTFTIDWENTESSTADVKITDTLPAGTSYVANSGSVTVTSGTSGVTSFTAPDANGNISWGISSASAGATGTVTYQVKVEESIFDQATPVVKNTAQVKIGNNPAVNTNTTTNEVPKKTVTATSGNVTLDPADGQLVGVGSTLTYTVNWSNDTGATATVVITDDIPEKTTLVDGSISDPGTVSGSTITWNLGEKESGDSGSVTFQVTVDNDAIDLDDNTVENTGKVKIGDNPAVSTNTTKNPVPEKTVTGTSAGTTVGNGDKVQVGDILTYTIYYINTLSEAATVDITDTIPTGTTFVDADNSGAVVGGTYVHWSIADVAANTSGTVSFRVRVNENALSNENKTISNAGFVKLGDNPRFSTNTVTNTVDDGTLEISKTTEKATTYTGEMPTDASFTFRVNLYDTTGNALTGSYSFTGKQAEADADDSYTGTVSNNSTVTLKAGGKITVSGLPEGSTWTVTEIESSEPGFSTVPSVHEGTIPETDVADSAFRNIYEPGAVDVSARARKVLNGRTLQAEEFEYRMTVNDEVDSDGNPVTSNDTEGWSMIATDGTSAGTGIANNDADGVINFGSIHITQAGTYTVKIWEVVPDDATAVDSDGNPVYETDTTTPLTYSVASATDSGYDVSSYTWIYNYVTYDTDARTFTVTVTGPDTNGNLSYSVTSDSGTSVGTSAVFTNTYNPPDNTKTVSATQPNDDGTYPTTPTITDADGKQVQIGDKLHYTINWVNDALDDAGKPTQATVTVTDTVPAGTVFVDDSAIAYDSAGTQIATGTYDETSNIITWTLPDRDALATGTAEFDVTVDASVLDNAYTIDNTATVQIGDDSKNTNTTHNTVPEKDVSNVTTGINISDANGQLVGVGNTLKYTVHWRNDATDENGDPTTAVVTVTDEVPGYTTYSDGTAKAYLTSSTTSIADGVYAANESPATGASKGTITWTLGTESDPLPAGASGTVVYEVTVDSDAFSSDGISNVATVKVGDNPAVKSTPTLNLVPNKLVGTSDTNVTIAVYGNFSTVNGGADGQLVGVGDILTYYIPFINLSGDTVNMSAVDTVPDGTEYVEGSANAMMFKFDDSGNITTDTEDITNTLGTITVSDSNTISWQYSNVPGYASGYVSFQVKVTEDALSLTPDDNTVENTAQVKIGDSPWASTNTVTNPVPEKDVSATLDPSGNNTTIEDADGKLVGVGDKLTFKVNWTNTEDSTANVVVTDTVPNGTYVDADTPAKAYDSEGNELTENVTITQPSSDNDWTYTWNLANRDAGASGYVTFTVYVSTSVWDYANVVENTGKVKIGDHPEVSTNTTTNPVPTKSVEVEGVPTESESTTLKTMSGHIVGVGDTLTYTIDWTNAETEAAQVAITDVIPAGTEYVDGSAKAYQSVDDGNGGTTQEQITTNALITTTTIDGSPAVSWTLYNRPAGDIGTVTFQVKVTEDAIKLNTAEMDEVTNQATVTIGDNPSVKTNTTTNPVPEKNVDVTPATDTTTIITDADGNVVGVGDTLHYKIYWENTESKSATVNISDVIPDGTAYVEDSAAEPTFTNGQIPDDGTSTVELTNSDGDNVVTWSFDATAGAAGYVTFDVTVDESATELATKSIDNTATLQIDDDPEMSTNTTHNPVPSKTVDHTSGTTTIQDAEGNLVGVGDVLTYYVNWVNQTSDKATVTITDQVPDGTEFVSANNGGTTSTVDGKTVVTWSLGEQEAGASGKVSFHVRVTDAAMDLSAQQIENTAQVTIGDNPAVKTNPVDNPVPPKTVGKSDSPTTSIDGKLVGVGDTLTYTVKWANTNSEVAKITVTDEIPTGTKYVSGSARISSGNVLVDSSHPTTITDSSSPITWEFYANAGESGTVTFNVEITDEAVVNGDVENTATIQVGENGPTVKTNTTTNPTPKKDVQNASGTSIDGKYVGVGDTLHYVVNYANTESTAGTVTVIDTIPDGTSYDASNPSAKAYDSSGNEITASAGVYDSTNKQITWTINDVAAGATGTVVFDVTVTEDVLDEADNTVSNFASVNGVKTNTVTNTVPEKDVSMTQGTTVIQDADGRLVQSGDVLTYTIHWKNNESSIARVVVNDTIPAGTEYVADSAKAYDSTGAQITDDANITINGSVNAIIYSQAPGAEGTVTFQVTVTDDAYNLSSMKIENKATVKIGNNPSVSTNPVDNPLPEKDVSTVDDSDNVVIQDADGRTIQIGDRLKYTVHWSNDAVDEDGNPTTAKIIVTDEIPAGTTYVADSAKAYDSTGAEITSAQVENNDGTLTWTLDEQAANATGTVVFTVEVHPSIMDLETRVIDNTAYVQIGENGPTVKTNTTENNVPGKSVGHMPASDLTTYVKNANGNLVGVGDVLAYNISWSNTEDSAATIVIKDKVPAGTTIIAGSISEGGGYDANTNTVTWTLNNRPSGDSGTVSFNVLVDQSVVDLIDDPASGTIKDTVKNTATIKIGDNPEVSTNTVTNPVPEKDVTNVTKNIQDADGKAAAVGDVLTYTVHWRNTSSETTNITITDTVPDGTTFVEQSAGTDSNGSYIAPDSKGKLTWTLENVGSNASGTVTFQVKVDDSVFDLPAQIVENVATVKINGDPEISTNTVTNPVSGKEVENSSGGKIDGSQVAIGDELTYIVHYSNAESSPAQITITDQVPDGTAYVSGSATSSADNATVTLDSTNKNITWTIPGVASGDSGTVSFRVKVTEDAVEHSTITNEASIKVGDNDPMQTNKVENNVPTKKVTDSQNNYINGKLVKVGDELTYEVNYANLTSEPADVTITDSIPAGTEYVENSVSEGGSYSDTDNKVTWTFEDVAAGTSGTVSFKVKVTDAVFDNADNTIVNTASVQLNDDPAVDTNPTHNTVPEKEVANVTKSITDADGQPVSVGDILTYTVSWANYEPAAADVTVSDTFPEGTAYVANSAASSEANTTITTSDTGVQWVIPQAASGASGTVTFQVKVDPSVLELEGQTVKNQATIQLGPNDPAVSTNIVTNEVKTGTLTISKAITKADASLTPDPDAKFTFTVTLADEDGNALTDTYALSGEDANGKTTITSGETIQLKADGAVTIVDLPDGAQWTVEEVTDEGTMPGGFTIGEADKTQSGTISTDESATASTAAFTNTYDTTETYDSYNFGLNKVLKGRDWISSDYFNFDITAAAGTPMPEATTVTVTSDTATDGEAVRFGFGDIVYTRPGTYTYTITEQDAGKSYDGVNYTTNVATVVVTAVDDGEGGLTITHTVTNETFTNNYKPGEIDFDAVAGMQIVKNLTGKDITAGEFTFTLAGADDASTAKLEDGTNQTYTTTAQSIGTNGIASDLVAAPTGLVFGTDDAGKTYSYTVTETIPTDDSGNTVNPSDGVTYDTSQHTLKFVVTEDQTTGVITVTATVDEGTTSEQSFIMKSGDANGSHSKVTFTFNNSYEATAVAVTLNATKAMTGATLNNSQFAFRVTDATYTDYVVSSGVNDANGNISLSPITYNKTRLEQEAAANYCEKATDEAGRTTYTYNYTVSEDAFDPDYGITQDERSFNVNVVVTDDNAGNLTAAVTYPTGTEDDTLEMTNEYKANNVEVTLKGSKQLNVISGNNAPNIAGKYAFTVTGSAGAPMPTRTQTVNDANGTVDFGTITYTLENVFGTDSTIGQARSKTFTYTIAETEVVPVTGVTNDTSKTVTVVVTDDGYGNLTASTNVINGELFTFNNSYQVEPVTSQFTVKKNLTVESGTREMKAGEFHFQMIDATGQVFSSGVNDANGVVTMSPIEFTAPGDYSYVLSEVAGSATGITYDTATNYNVTAHVADQGDGTMTVTWTFVNASTSQEVDTPEFTNVYDHEDVDATATLAAVKQLNGGTLSAGAYSFQLLDDGGDVIQTVQNDGTGAVAFDTLSYSAEGTYNYTIKEVLPTDDDSETDGIQSNDVTYDEYVHTATVTVSSSGNGILTAKVVYDNGNSVVPIFTNTVVEEPTTPPTTPPTVTPPTVTPPATPATPVSYLISNLPKTADDFAAVGLLALIIAMAGGAIAATIALRRRRLGGDKK